MARAQGNKLNYWRCDVNAWVVRSTATTDTIHIQAIWVCTGYNVASSGVQVGAWVDGIGSSGWQSIGYQSITTGERVVYEWEITANKVANARNLSCWAGIQVPYGDPGTSNAGVSVTVAGVQYARPDPVTNLAVSRVSDTSAKVTWTNHPNAGALKPYSQVIVDWWPDVGTATGTWKTLKTLSGTTANLTATGLTANSRYRFKVYARNSAGDSSQTTSQWLYTAPAAPRTVTATKTETGVRVVADVSNSRPSWVTLWRQAGDGEWENICDAASPMSLSGGQATYVDTGAPAGTVRYKAYVRRVILGDALTTDLTKTLVSTETVSNDVTTISPPAAPTILTPANGSAVANTDGTAQCSWRPNHPDGTVQTAAQVEYAFRSWSSTSWDGVASHTLNVTGNVTSVLLELASYNGYWRVRVRTKGLHADWGAWSDYASFTVATLPSIVLHAPATITSSPFVLSWSVADTTGVSEQRLSIEVDGRSVWTTQPAADARDLTIQPTDYLPLNGATLLFRLSVRAGSTLTGEATAVSVVEYTPPALPTVTVTPTDDMGATITVAFNRHNPGDTPQEHRTYWAGDANDSPSVMTDMYTAWQDDAGNSRSVLLSLSEGVWRPATVSAMVERVDADGTVTLIATGLTDGQSCHDPLPPLNTDTTYRTSVFADSGASASMVVTAHVASNVNAINFGADAGVVLLMGLGQSVSRTIDHDVTEFDFADGSPYTVAFESGLVTASVSTSDTRAFSQAEYQRLVNLAETYAFGWFRDAAGLREYARIALQVAYDVTAKPRTITCTADITRQSWREPV